MATCAGLFASKSRWVASLVDGATGTEFLVGDKVVIRPKSSILFEALCGTGSMFGDAVRIGPKSTGLVLAESDGGPFGGENGAWARCGYDGRVVGTLGGKRGARSP